VIEGSIENKQENKRMEALAGYGSDDSSLSSSNGDAQKKPALSRLVDYSDDESSAEGDSPTKKEIGNAIRKRKRSWDNGGTADILPPPPLSSSSMIHWTKDYSSRYRTAGDSSQVSAELIQKLETLRSGAVSWAHHLKSQHEFHNPHFFDDVVTHFGIQAPLDSNIEKLSFQKYEFDLPAVEEQARIRQQEQQQSTTVVSQFAHEQLERAMQTTNKRP
jgi:HCNGP-like protein